MVAEHDIRPAAVAGSFYPGSPERLAADVDGLLAGALVADLDGVLVRGVVTPHAGYVYSGPIAATAYACLRQVPTPRRIVILGPSHFEPLRGLAVTGATAWRTPLGEVAIDATGRDALAAGGAAVDDQPHRSEHSIEVQMPFLQRCFPGVPVLPVAVGTGSPEEGALTVAGVLDEGTVLVVSTDLSHYQDAAAARQLDARTAAAVESLDTESLGWEDACGVDALRLGMAWARWCGYGIRLLDLRNSADTAGDPNRVVGYGAFSITSEAGERPSG